MQTVKIRLMLSNTSTIKASNLRKSEIGEIASFSDESLANKFLNMSILTGSKIELVRKSTFGQTFYLKINNRTIAMRKEEVSCIMIKKID